MVLVRIPGAQLIVDVEKSSNLELDSKFTSKEATIEDLDALIDICLNDASVSNFGKEGLENFFKSNLFNEDSKDKSVVILLSEKEKPIGVIGAVHAALDNGKLTGGRMVAVRKGSEESFSSLISAFSNYLKSKNWLLPFTIPVDNTVEY